MDKTLKTRLPAFGSRPLVIMLAVFLLGTAVYLPTLSYDFVWDDNILIKNNPQIKNPGQAWRLLFSDFHISQYSKFYRPLVMISFAGDHALYKDNAGGYHLTNAVLHGLNSALLALVVLCRKTGSGRDLGAFVWAPLFFLLALWSKETAAGEYYYKANLADPQLGVFQR